MKRFLLIAALMLPVSLFGAAGDVTGVNVEANGWVLNLTCEAGTNGGFPSFGFGANNTITGNEKVKLTVTSPGFDDNGTSNTITRTIYGTKQLRLPYPLQATYDVITNDTAGTVEIRLALSDWIYANDTATFSIASGLYTNGAISSGTASGTLTINSTQVHPKVIGNWTWPGFNLVTNTMRLRAVAFHRSAQEGRPVRCVKFYAMDAHSHAVTNIVTTMRIDRTLPDAVPFGEYYYDMDVSSFTQGDKITCGFTAYPWIGDSGSVLDTLATGFVWPTPYPAPLTNWCNNSGTYGCTRAIVDSASGSDTTGIAACDSYWATNQTPAAFATIGRAFVAIAGTNAAQYSRTEIGGGVVYLAAGNHNYAGSSFSLANPATSWCNIEPAPGVSQWGAVIAAFGTDGRGLDDRDLVKITGIKYSCSTSPHTRQNIWHDGCFIADATAATFFQTGTTVACGWWLTHCIVSNLTQGLKGYAANPLLVPLIRGNTLADFAKEMSCYTVLGNLHPASAKGGAYSPVWDNVNYTNAWGIVYGNRFLGMASGDGADMLLGPTAFTQTNGFVIVQNMWECKTNTGGTGPNFKIGSLNAASYTNGIVWNNCFLGARNFYAYNDLGSAAAWRWQWSTKNNVFEDYNLKTDTHNDPGADGGRVGNWPVLFGVGTCGNVDLCTADIGAPTAFYNSESGLGGFDGLSTYVYYAANSATSSTNWPAWVDRKANDGINDRPGGGNYKVQSKSPLVQVETEWLLPFDLEGNARGRFDPPGAYSSASPRKGGGFF